MLIGHLAIIAAALFTGAAIYILVAEQPARLALADGPQLAEWQASYPRAAAMQGGLALAGGLLGLIAWFLLGDWRWGLGAVVLLTAWPYTLFLVSATNTALKAVEPGAAGPETRRLVERWGTLHAGRSALGVAAALLYLWAAA